MSNRKISKAKMCWHCEYGRFERTNTSGAVRYRGTCVEGVPGEEDIPYTYRPPKAFYIDIRDGLFCTDYGEFVQNNATVYWPHRVFMDQYTKGEGIRYLSEERLKKEHQHMCWLYKNRELIDSISWSDVCDKYRRKGT